MLDPQLLQTCKSGVLIMLTYKTLLQEIIQSTSKRSFEQPFHLMPPQSLCVWKQARRAFETRKFFNARNEGIRSMRTRADATGCRLSGRLKQPRQIGMVDCRGLHLFVGHRSLRMINLIYTPAL